MRKISIYISIWEWICPNCDYWNTEEGTEHPPKVTCNGCEEEFAADSG